MMTLRKRPRSRGLVSMEIALLLPLLMVLAMAIIEGGTMLYSWMTLQKAAQSGTRFAATGQGEDEGTRLSQITAVTEGWLDRLNKGTKEITITSWPDKTVTGDGIDNSAGGPCTMVQVAVLYNYHPFTPVVGNLLPEVVELRGADRKLNEPWKPCD
ncbi:TadE/TadG family type IV pilus assembly protein [uncultured Pseudodesulfovibrio sp.]|uniref:TadE/TadG family type IV pilus assembly protein n=1 Tax=uncultured Pseudodesulfovibrio sp. TaxID=2035858 RepID=UPI0029C85EE8|nr:TadE/TadG family type IV pilus assembly protein [uncultured Pseudodesulfovibrio sp.]